ncbi:MAG: FAD-dependent oxidoreductase [Bacteroidia bacterium]|nr:FAD-dependent oxidoreductase [Bacteroidia bacterium]
MKNKVIILGGGVAGLSAAHELIERGFDVHVYELKGIPGGKARSVKVPDSGKDNRKDLPGEHGFRFFPGFYRHVTDTMKRIPCNGQALGVFDNLVDATRGEMARFDKSPIKIVTRFPRNLKDLKAMISTFEDSDVGFTKEEKDFFAERLWQIMTSCENRRVDEYEKICWWDYVQADRFSENYKTLLATGLTRTLVAAKATEASTKTGGDIILQLIFDMMKIGSSSDRLLNGPTNDVWIDPWLKYLKEMGVHYHLNTKVESINCKDGAIQSATINNGTETLEVTGDYYIAALPVEVMSGLISDEMLEEDPTLSNIQKLRSHVAWMNGIQFYLKEDVEIIHGHVIYIDTPWALTSISQKQFWKDFDFPDHGDGKVNGILSVDVSNWDGPGILYNKSAKDCTREEIKDEIWAQLKKSLNVNGKEILKDDNLNSWFLDPDIIIPDDMRPHDAVNLEPLLVNATGTWYLRPDAFTRIPNLFLASDYVRTNTDLATMEGANEAARRAVNCIIDASKVDAAYCEIWKLHEPNILSVWRNHDQKRYDKGLPWEIKIPWFIEILQKIKLMFS